MITVPINPDILTWARERCKLSLEDLALSLDLPIDKLKAYEDGREKPPLGLLEKLAYSKLRVPLAVFFFSERPTITDPLTKMRRLPNYEQEKLSQNTLAAIRLAQSYQDSLEELVGESELPFSDLRIDSSNPIRAAKALRQIIGFTLEQQLKLRSPEKVFKALRHTLEKWGIYTFKDSLEDRFVSGFCLFDEIFPVIFINNSNAPARQLFTLVHEFAHIVCGVTGVTDIDERYIEMMADPDRDIEVRCNRFASQFLLPDSESDKIAGLYRRLGPEGIGEIASMYSISREFVLRRLLEIKQVTADIYTKKAAEWNADYLRGVAKGSQGNYYRTQLSYLGESFVVAAFRKFKSGQIDQRDLARHLNIRTANVLKLEAYLR
ncbi:MAG: ImmA/IrrE family metallo-endopeptidase [Elusimicrobiales bacterium]